MYYKHKIKKQTCLGSMESAQTGYLDTVGVMTGRQSKHGESPGLCNLLDKKPANAQPEVPPPEHRETNLANRATPCHKTKKDKSVRPCPIQLRSRRAFFEGATRRRGTTTYLEEKEYAEHPWLMCPAFFEDRQRLSTQEKIYHTHASLITMLRRSR